MDSNELNETVRAMASVLAPVFLITGVAAVLNTMTTRYGRVIDRVRVVLRESQTQRGDERLAKHHEWEIRSLFSRARLLRAIIIMAASSIFCVSMTMFLLFAGTMANAPVGKAPVVFFVASIVALIIAMALFIQDLALSLRTLKADIRFGTEGKLQP